MGGTTFYDSLHGDSKVGNEAHVLMHLQITMWAQGLDFAICYARIFVEKASLENKLHHGHSSD